MHVYVIAEIASNHDRDLQRAKDLIHQAAAAGADAAKFQFFRADSLAKSRNAQDYWQVYKDNELPEGWLPLLKEECDRVGIDFLCTAYDQEGALKVEPYVWAHKIASFEAHSRAYVGFIGGRERSVILSTGMMGMSEVWDRIALLASGESACAYVLHCVSAYPTPYRDVNLRASLESIADIVGWDGTGLSDHTPGISVPIAAAALGARCIEKHVTDDRTRKGPDHPISIEFTQFAQMVSMIREVEEALGLGVKRPMPSEEPMMKYRAVDV